MKFMQYPVHVDLQCEIAINVHPLDRCERLAGQLELLGSVSHVCVGVPKLPATSITA